MKNPLIKLRYLIPYLFVIGCLMPPPPRTYYYKPVGSSYKDLNFRAVSSCVYQKYLDLWITMSLINTSSQHLNVDISNINLNVHYKNIPYDSIHLLQASFDDKLRPGNRVINKDEKFKLLPNDTLTLDFILKPLNRNLPQEEFVKYWKNDTLKLQLRIKDKIYL